MTAPTLTTNLNLDDGVLGTWTNEIRRMLIGRELIGAGA